MGFSRGQRLKHSCCVPRTDTRNQADRVSRVRGCHEIAQEGMRSAASAGTNGDVAESLKRPASILYCLIFRYSVL